MKIIKTKLIKIFDGDFSRFHLTQVEIDLDSLGIRTIEFNKLKSLSEVSIKVSPEIISRSLGLDTYRLGLMLKYNGSKKGLSLYFYENPFDENDLTIISAGELQPARYVAYLEGHILLKP